MSGEPESAEDAELLANWQSGPGARTTAADRELVRRASAAGRVPRRTLSPEASAELARRVEQPQRATPPKMAELLRSSRGRVKRDAK